MPDNSVLSPDTPDSEIRGSTTQNLASSTIRPAACLAIFALTSTMAKSSESSMAVTTPIRTSLYLMNVLPGSMPLPSFKAMVMVGPSLRTR